MNNNFFQSLAEHSNSLGIDIAKDYFLVEAIKNLHREKKNKEKLHDITSTLVKMVYRLEKLNIGAKK
jgi:hypothetical protein